MKSLVATVFAVAILCAAPAQGEVFELSFTGEVALTSFNGGPGDAIVEGTTISNLDTATGTLRFDSDATPGLVEGTTGALYEAASPFFFSVDINGVEFSNDGVFATIVANNNPGGVGPTDSFNILDGRDPLNSNPVLTGDSILINQQPRDASLLFGLVDRTSNLFDSLALPTDLEFSDFDDILTSGDIVGNNENGVRFSVAYRINLLNLAAVSVPEPGVSVLFGVACLSGLLSRRRHQASAGSQSYN